MFNRLYCSAFCSATVRAARTIPYIFITSSPSILLAASGLKFYHFFLIWNLILDLWKQKFQSKTVLCLCGKLHHQYELYSTTLNDHTWGIPRALKDELTRLFHIFFLSLRIFSTDFKHFFFFFFFFFFLRFNSSKLLAIALMHLIQHTHPFSAYDHLCSWDP